jgi:Zn-dependent membrane protease YugP
MTDGVKTSEFWLSLIAQVAGAVIPLLILYGVINAEQGAAWQGLIIALAAVLVPLILAGVAKNYADNRTMLKVEVAQLESLREQRLEALGRND